MFPGQTGDIVPPAVGPGVSAQMNISRGVMARCSRHQDGFLPLNLSLCAVLTREQAPEMLEPLHWEKQLIPPEEDNLILLAEIRE